jgi:hypothetical protein
MFLLIAGIKDVVADPDRAAHRGVNLRLRQCPHARSPP